MRILSALLIVATLACLAAFSGTSSSPLPQDDGETQLAGYFKEINKGYRKLRVSVKKAERDDESLGVLREIQALALKCKVEDPLYTKQIPEADRKTFLVEYRKQVVELIKLALDAEVALLEGRNTDAETLVGQLYDLKAPSHKLYRAPKDDK